MNQPVTRHGEPTPTMCEWEDCLKEADCGVNAQWSVVDFVEYFSCAAHAYDMVAILHRRRVDGELPVDEWVHWWR